jgi:hypothetical protein
LRLGFAPAKAFAGTDPQPKAVHWEPVNVTVTTEVTGDTEPRPPSGIEELPPAGGASDSLRDRIAVLAALGVVVGLVGAAGAWFLRKRRRVVPPSPQEWAAAQLDELGPDDPAFADRLSDVLRTYLERRSGLPATRQTTAELLSAAESAAGPDVVPVDLVRPVLERCDAAKFAGLDPTPDERRQLLATAREIVTLGPPMTDPHNSRAPRRQWLIPALLALVLLVVGGTALTVWGYVRWRSAQRDQDEVGRLNHQVAILHQPLSDADFDEALALCDSRDAEVRLMALSVAAATTKRSGDADRAARVLPVALRLLADSAPGPRRVAIDAVGALGTSEHADLVRPFLQSADARERQSAERAVGRLEPRPAK